MPKASLLYLKYNTQWMSDYRSRLIDSELKDELEAFGAILIIGPKWCGKTTTASQFSKSILRMQDPDTIDRNVALARLKPSELLIGENPRLIDEWQTAPQIWDSVRLSVDLRNEPGLYILTGSTTVDMEKISHSGTGRIDKLRMNTMSLFESGDSIGSVSLTSLFNDTQKSSSGISDKNLEDLAGLIVRGGWPQSIGKNEKIGQRLIKGYCENIIDTEVVNVDGRKRDSHRMRGLMRSLSRNISSPISKKNIIDDMSSKEDCKISENTLNDYLNALRGIYVLDEMPAWNPNLRSKTAIRTADTLHLCDPAIAAYFLSASKEDLMHDPKTFGLLFESLVIRDLRIYSQNIGGDVFHYRDKSGLEADAVIRLHDGKWAAIEVKLGESWVEESANHLLKLKDKIDTSEMGEPSFMAVVTGTDYAYTREDGVHVIPISCLRN